MANHNPYYGSQGGYGRGNPMANTFAAAPPPLPAKPAGGSAYGSNTAQQRYPGTQSLNYVAAPAEAPPIPSKPSLPPKPGTMSHSGSAPPPRPPKPSNQVYALDSAIPLQPFTGVFTPMTAAPLSTTPNNVFEFFPTAPAGSPLFRAFDVEVSFVQNGIKSTSIRTSLMVYRSTDTSINAGDATNASWKTFMTGHLALENVIDIALTPDTPTFSPDQGCYAFQVAKDTTQYFIVQLATAQEDSVVEKLLLDSFEWILDEITTFQKVELTQEQLIDTERSRKLSHTATKIEAGGQAVGKGLIRAAGGIGSALKSGTNFYISHTKGVEEGEAMDVSEEEKARLEASKKRTASIAKGTGAVVDGIGKGLGYVGTGIAKGVNFGSQKYKETEYAKKKEEEAKAKGKTADGSAAFGVAKASVHAIGSVFSGAKQASVNVATDVRDTAVERTRHKEGDARAQVTQERYNMAADIGLSGGNVASVYLMATAQGAVEVATRVGSKVGAGLSHYDALKNNVLFGAPWKMGWISYRMSLSEGWKSCWLAARSYTVAVYASPKDPWSRPLAYWKYLDVKSIQPVGFDIFKRSFAFQILTSSDMINFSVECSDQPDWSHIMAHAPPNFCESLVREWVAHLETLLFFNRILPNRFAQAHAR